MTGPHGAGMQGMVRALGQRRRGAILICVAALAGCGESSSGPAGVLTSEACRRCHGSENAAPPRGISSGLDTTDKAVGAHQIHLKDGPLRARIPCRECHVVPADHDDTSHADVAPAEMDFGALATNAGAEPSWDGASATCSDVYCHGATLRGGLNTSPTWIVVGSGEAACGSCHGLPPPFPHVSSTDCVKCHDETVDEDNAIDLLSVTHIDGQVQATGGGKPPFVPPCTQCHGSDDDPSPPLSVDGYSDTAAVEVGAHRSHLRDGAIRMAVPCHECHLVPGDWEAPGHIDPSPAELIFGTLATTGDASPSWDHAAESCSDVYCHGATLAGGDHTAPVWTVVDGTEAACGTCHGNPPPLPHPPSSDCHKCHDKTIDAQGNIDVGGGKHIDGTLQYVVLTCTTCHGSDTNFAPPVSTTDETSTQDVSVGAHQAHLVDGPLAKALWCNACHAIPNAIYAPGHIDPAPAELTWGTLATTDGATPGFDETEATCSGTYCHGETLGGGFNKIPTWTQVGAGEAACGSCHGVPPPPPHMANGACYECHGLTVDASFNLNLDTHVDGILQVTLSCTSCHGDAGTGDPAPPLGTAGETLTTQAAVGAHQQHLGQDSGWHADVTCEACHALPSSTAHADGTTDFAWGPLATTDGATPGYDSGSLTCAGVYCHGTTLMPGGSVTTPAWILVDGSQDACGTCHGLPPAGTHPASSACQMCHDGVVQSFDPANPQNTTWTDPTLHIDGVVNVGTLTCTSCHGDIPTDDPAPPMGTAGELATSDPAVGAHQEHLATATGWHRDVVCSDCHTVPVTTMHADDVTDLVWGAVATADSATPAYDFGTATCSGVYCHGETLMPGGTSTTPSWTVVDGSQDACGSCHGLPPGGTHPPSDACAMCHDAVVASYDPADPQNTVWADPSLHVDGVVNVGTLTCTSCHGDAGTNDPAPPVGVGGETLTTEAAVGAHQAHLQTGTGWHADVGCEACHVAPASTLHTDGATDLGWGFPTNEDGATPSYDFATTTCSGVYCHGETLLPGGTLTQPDWTVVDDSQDACGTCHGLPPGPTHPPLTQCEGCHDTVVTDFDPANPQNTVWNDPTLHINGTVEWSMGGACDGCHGAPPATGAHLVHFGATPTDASYGGTGVTADLLPGGTAYAFDCGNCHPTDPSHHANGVPNTGGGNAEIDLSPVGAPPGSLKAQHPTTASYQPGGTVFTDAGGLAYTIGSCGDVYCHSDLGVTSGAVPQPVVDFPFIGYPIVYPPYTVSLSRSYQTVGWGDTLSCDGCHGFPPRTYDPEVKAGVGQSHSWIDEYGYENLHGYTMSSGPVACASCHHATVHDQGVRGLDANWLAFYEPVPIVGHDQHVDGAPDVAFTPDLVPIFDPPGFDLTVSSWDGPTKTCRNVPCHLSQTEVVWGGPYRWWVSEECNFCHQY